MEENKMSMRRLIAVSALFLVSQAQAAIVNGGFETGNYTGWSTIGTNAVVNSTFGTGPVEGAFQSLSTTGARPGVRPASQSALETFLGLRAGTLDLFGNGNVFEGSAIKQTISMRTGETLSFSWNFLTDEFTPDPNFSDFAFFMALNGVVTELADTGFPVFVDSPSAFFEETGFFTETLLNSSARTFTLGFGVVDVRDTILDSGLLIDAVRIGSVSVPEPGTLSLIAIGLAGLGIWRIRPGVSREHQLSPRDSQEAM
jgi:hypothetical protein